MVFIAYFTELNLHICDYMQKRHICRENCKYALDERFHGHFCPCQVLPPWSGYGCNLLLKLINSMGKKEWLLVFLQLIFHNFFSGWGGARMSLKILNNQMMKEQHHQKGGHCVRNGRYVDSGRRMIGVLPTQLNAPEVTFSSAPFINTNTYLMSHSHQRHK